MSNTTANEVIQSFESSFVDKKVLPESLEMEWLRKAIGRFSIELDPLNFDVELNEFDCRLDRYVIDTLEASLWVLLKSKSYKESIIGAINLGNDSDTIGALVGGLSGIYYNDINNKWLNDIKRKNYLLDLCNDFYNSLL